MEIELSDEAKADLLFWKQAGDHKMMNRITSLILSIQQTPHTGIGKPEPLRYKLKGLWSRRINREHRLIYEVLDKQVVIHSMKGHYE